MRAKGIALIILGIVLFAVSLLMVGNHDIAGMLGSILMGIGGAGVVAGLSFLLVHKPKMQ